MIYFVRLPSNSIKIGYTANIDQRMAKLRAVYGISIKLLAAMPGDRIDEQDTHEIFSCCRFKGTEQFRPIKELINFIGCPSFAGVNPETVKVSGQAKFVIDAVLSKMSRRLLRRICKKFNITPKMAVNMAIHRTADWDNLMQCKDIPDHPILEFLAQMPKESIGANWLDLNGDIDARSGIDWKDILSHSVRHAFPTDVPDKLVLAKMKQLIHRGVVDGCGCGCRGDFTITNKGLAELEGTK